MASEKSLKIWWLFFILLLMISIWLFLQSTQLSPPSTTLELSDGIIIELPDSTILDLPNGKKIVLPLGAKIELPNGEKAQVLKGIHMEPIGFVLIELPDSTILDLPNGKKIILPLGAKMELYAGSQFLSSDSTTPAWITNLELFITAITPLVGLLGTIIASLLLWRKGKQESIAMALDNQKKALEIEQLRRQLEEKNKSTPPEEPPTDEK